MKLIFVYNATSGSVRGYLDSLHKILSPATYDCNLCDITFGVFSEKSKWKKFRKSSTTEMIFLHKDQFLKQYRSKWLPNYEFPIVLSEENDGLHIFITPDELNAFENSEQLMAKIKERL